MDAGDYAGACPKLAASFAEDPATGTELALAMCQEHNAQPASAWANYADVAARAKQEGRADREDMARQRIAALEPMLTRLTITVDKASAAIAGLTVKRDGEAVPGGAWGEAVPLDPGDHVVEASAPGMQTWKARLTITLGGQPQTVRVPVLESEVKSLPTPPGQAAPMASTESEVRPDRAPLGSPGADLGNSGEGFPTRTIGLVIGAAGVLGLGVGGFFAIRAKSLVNQSNAGDHCNSLNQCDPYGGAKRDDAKRSADIATIGGMAGGVLAATGITLFVLGGSSAKQPTTASLELSSAVGRGAGAAFLRGHF